MSSKQHPMAAKQRLYATLPDSAQPIAKQLWNRYRAVRTGDWRYRRQYVNQWFDRTAAYDQYCREFSTGVMQTVQDVLADIPDDANIGRPAEHVMRRYYALIREVEPEIVVETGVCNGFSTLAILSGLDENGHGELYSIDYPHRADESLDEYRAATFSEYGGAAIPSDKDPGWIIPEMLRDAWSLRIGKSQRELPKQLQELGEYDIFLHDSEHSHPCMMMEYELAWEYLREGGILISDDINWNDAWDTFIDARTAGTTGRINPLIGYTTKPSD